MKANNAGNLRKKKNSLIEVKTPKRIQMRKKTTLLGQRRKVILSYSKMQSSQIEPTNEKMANEFVRVRNTVDHEGQMQERFFFGLASCAWGASTKVNG